jgi:hypothetical protein
MDTDLNNHASDDALCKVASSGQGIPWHHAQLYRLYGEEADHFLHPKLNSEKFCGIQKASRLNVLRGNNPGKMF